MNWQGRANNYRKSTANNARGGRRVPAPRFEVIERRISTENQENPNQVPAPGKKISELLQFIDNSFSNPFGAALKVQLSHQMEIDKDFSYVAAPMTHSSTRSSESASESGFGCTYSKNQHSSSSSDLQQLFRRSQQVEIDNVISSTSKTPPSTSTSGFHAINHSQNRPYSTSSPSPSTSGQQRQQLFPRSQQMEIDQDSATTSQTSMTTYSSSQSDQSRSYMSASSSDEEEDMSHYFQQRPK